MRRNGAGTPMEDHSRDGNYMITHSFCAILAGAREPADGPSGRAVRHNSDKKLDSAIMRRYNPDL